jgi:hypothetical protein
MKKRKHKMNWIIRTRRVDRDIVTQKECPSFSADFNSPLSDNDVGVCVADPPVEVCTKGGRHEADDDIRKGQTKTFNNIDDLIAGLKQAW